MKPAFPILIIALSATPALAQEVNIEAKSLESTQEPPLVTASGSVVVNYEDAKLTADNLIFNQEKKTGQAHGHVRLERAGSYLETDSIDFDLSAPWAKTGKFQGLVANEGRFRGDSLFYTPDKSTAEGAIFSNCMTADTFMFRSNQITYYPNQKKSNVSIGQSTFYLGGVPVVPLPPLTLTVGEPKEQQEPLDLQPQVGFNTIDGPYIQSQYGYRLSDNSFGSIPMRYSLFRGIYVGAQNTYIIDPKTNIYGNISYQNPWIEKQGGIRGTLAASHNLNPGEQLALTYGYRSFVPIQQATKPDAYAEYYGASGNRLELTYNRPSFQILPNIKFDINGGLGYYQDENTGISTPRLGIYPSLSGTYKIGKGAFNPYISESGLLLYPKGEFNYQSGTSLGARVSQDVGPLSLGAGGEVYRVLGKSPLGIDTAISQNRIFGGAGWKINPSWIISGDTSLVSYPNNPKWYLGNVSLGVDFIAPCLALQLRFQPLIMGYSINFQISNF